VQRLAFPTIAVTTLDGYPTLAALRQTSTVDATFVVTPGISNEGRGA
jgi:hypothetical protein